MKTFVKTGSDNSLEVFSIFSNSKMNKVIASISEKVKDGAVNESEILAAAKVEGILDKENIAHLMDAIEDSGIEIRSIFSSSLPASKRSDDGDLNSLALYFGEVGQYKLLTQEEELELGRKIHNGDKGKDQAFEKMVNANLRLVIPIARRYSFKGELMDLIQAGNMGLMKAVELYDPDQGNKFSTYATWWIRKYIVRSVSDTSSLLRIPAYIMEGVGNNIIKYINDTEEKTGKRPDLSELAEKFGLSVETIGAFLTVNDGISSIDEPVRGNDSNDSQETTAGDLIPCNQNVEDECMVTFRREDIIDVMKTVLKEREAKVILLHFGVITMDGYPTDASGGLSLSQIGKILSLTRERVRQIKDSALKKIMSSPEALDRLSAWLDDCA